MDKKEKKKTADVLTEKSRWIRIGWLFFILRPVTLGQIYEMGEQVEDMEIGDLSLNNRMNTIAEMAAHHKNAPKLQKIFLICLFRTRLMRFLFGWFIKHRLTPKHINILIESLTVSYSANFFLTSIIFLRQTKTLTEPRQTTALGQQSEE